MGNGLRGHERVEVDGRDNGTCPTHGSESQSPSQQKLLRTIMLFGGMERKVS